jgi:hypothetical protein
MLGVAGDILLEMAQASKREVQPVTGELAQKVLARHAKGA